MRITSFLVQFFLRETCKRGASFSFFEYCRNCDKNEWQLAKKLELCKTSKSSTEYILRIF